MTKTLNFKRTLESYGIWKVNKKTVYYGESGYKLEGLDRYFETKYEVEMYIRLKELPDTLRTTKRNGINKRSTFISG